jgi:hypothetical protein
MRPLVSNKNVRRAMGRPAPGPDESESPEHGNASIATQDAYGM